MVTFVLLAAALTVAGVIAVVIPLLRGGVGAAAPGPAPWAAVAAAVVLVIGSAVLYVSWSNWPWRTVTPGDSPQSMVARLARELDRRAGRLIERALVLAPDSGKALFFGGAVAARRGDLPLARARFVKLLGMDPPANVRPLIEQQITAIDGQLAGAAPASAAAAQSPPPAAKPAAEVRVNVTLAPSDPSP